MAQDVPNAANVLQEVLVDFIDPQKVASASMREILDIRKKLLPSMRRFRIELEGTVARLSTLTNLTKYEDGGSSSA